MKQAEYMKAQVDLIAAARTIEQIDLNALLRAISNAETLAPILDPTLYRKAQANLHGIKRLAEAALPVQVAVRELRDAVMETAAMGYMEKPKDEIRE
jgi:signal transduction histidine kinase